VRDDNSKSKSKSNSNSNSKSNSNSNNNSKSKSNCLSQRKTENCKREPMNIDAPSRLVNIDRFVVVCARGESTRARADNSIASRACLAHRSANGHRLPLLFLCSAL
jgi:hypothetical protein